MLSILNLYPLQNALSRPITILNIRMNIKESIRGGPFYTGGGGGEAVVFCKKLFRKYIYMEN